MQKFLLSILIILFIGLPINSQDSIDQMTYQQILDMPIDSTKKDTQSLASLNDPFVLKTKRAKSFAITGTALYATALCIEWPIFYPWAKEIIDENLTIGDQDSMDIDKNLALQAARIPIGLLKISGPLLSTIGTINAHKSYSKMKSIKKVKKVILIPYISGWALYGIGTILGSIGSRNNNKNLINTATGFTVATDIAWTITSVYALIETIRIKKQATESKGLSVVPYGTISGANGVAFVLTF